MKHPPYTAGLVFISSTPTHSLSEGDRKAIKTHATKASKKRRDASQLEPWISTRCSSRSTTKTPLLPASSISIPRRVGAFFSGIELPEGIEPSMIQDVVSLIELNKHGVYPHEVCLQMKVVERGWFPYMLSDACCLHSMMFSARVLIEHTSQDLLSPVARLHYAETLRLLQLGLSSKDVETATSDATLMVITTLAAVAHFAEDRATAAMHVKGLAKIVDPRGGVRALTAHRNMQVKVCRTDLTYALATSERPLLFPEGISWECYIADRNLVRCNHQPHGTPVQDFIETSIDTKLRSVWKDFHAFCCLSNIAYQTERRFSTETYNEIVISLLYRLTDLRYEEDPVQEALRLGLLALSSSVFLQRTTMQQPFYALTDAYDEALLNMPSSVWESIPLPIALWLLMMSLVIGMSSCCHRTHLMAKLRETMTRGRVEMWSELVGVLRSVAWIEFVHETPGKKVFAVAELRSSDVVQSYGAELSV